MTRTAYHPRADSSLQRFQGWLSALVQQTQTGLSAPPQRQAPGILKPRAQQPTRPHTSTSQSYTELQSTPQRTEFHAPLRGRVLVIADAQNLSYSLRKHGYDCDFAALLGIIHAHASGAHAHAFVRLPDQAACSYANHYFRGAGWHANSSVSPMAGHGPYRHRKANSDNDILLATGELIARHRPNTIVIASGDGDLGCDIAAHILQRLDKAQIHTVSISGTTSSRLHRMHNPHITANTLLGWDCICAAR